jgi:uroporphyrinogen-III synthase
MPFGGLRVISLESRRAAEIDLLVRKQGGDSFVAPSVKERALDDHTDAFALLEKLEADELDMLVLMTGVGLSFWREVISTRFPITRADEALRRVKLLARGPKPSAILRPLGLMPDITIPEPNTWREVVDVMHNRPEKRLGIQEYGRPNPEFNSALQALGIEVHTFALYRWELPDDLGPLREAVRRLVDESVDVILFTSSIQLEHLLTVAAEENFGEPVLGALRNRVAVASVGPIMTATLIEHGIQPDIVPISPKMGALVKAAADESGAVLATKRTKTANLPITG